MEDLSLKEKKDRPPLSEIRGKLALLKGTLEKREFLSCDSVPGGVPRGVICEVTGSARTEWILGFLKQNPALSTFWAEEKLTIFPTAIHQRGIDLERVLLAETGDKLFQALRKALKSKLFDCILLPGTIEEIKMLKALQLFARESNACVFFLSKSLKNSWAIPFQLEAEWAPHAKIYPELKSRVIECRGEAFLSSMIFTHVLKSKISQSHRAPENILEHLSQRGYLDHYQKNQACE